MARTEQGGGDDERKPDAEGSASAAASTGGGGASGAGGAGGAAGTTALAATEASISHEWARRRLDLYDRMERVIREEIAQALRTAADFRNEVERDAEAFLRQLNNERTRIADEVA